MAGHYVNHSPPGAREIKVGILTVSDRCSAGTQEDKSGPNLKALVHKHLQKLGVVQVLSSCVPDEVHIIKSCLLHWADQEKCVLILTTGGTGFSARDVTPEATKEVIEREAPGLAIRMLSKSIETTPMAMLSRPICGIRKSTIIVNLPGSKKGSQECFEFILPALPHAFDLVSSNEENVSQTHSKMQKSPSPLPMDNEAPTTDFQNGHMNSHDTDRDSGNYSAHNHHHHHHHHHDHNLPLDDSASGIICLVPGCDGSSSMGTPPPHSNRQSIESLQSLQSLQSYGSSITSSEPGGYSEPCYSGYSSSESGRPSTGCHHKKVYIDTPRVAERDRFSPYPMVCVSKALSLVLSCIKVPKKRHLVNLHAGLLGKILMEDVRAKEPYPPFAASVKDGYAVIASDGAGVRTVLEPITAGKVAMKTIRTGQCSRINTGAPLPPGADAVVMVEETELVESKQDGRVEVSVRIKTAPRVLQEVRPVGFDIKQGETILSSGEKLGPAELGLLAMAGVHTVSVYTPPSIGIISTGDELVTPGSKRSEGQIFDSNKIALLTAIREQGFNAADLGTISDDYSLMKEKLLNVIDDGTHRVIISTGGVSMGEKDLVKKFLENFGEVKFGRLNMKPGKPTTFATIIRGSKTTYFFALPGNPVSAMVTFYLFVLPAIRKLAGYRKPHLQRIQARIDFDACLDTRPEYHRSKLNWDTDDGVPLAVSTGSQCSSRLLSMRSCHALLELPSSDNTKRLTRGSMVTALLLPKLIT
ncbi:gephyrin-like [Clytia hemisphaerica]|uniref:MoaB/Mog domain-containing protein n=1 Tax=Clytia hemisphaerica TaxID=252671 RepID=A0A7M5XGB1_9CNID